jgi:isopentenyl-diphosphate delta-isomerase type 1
MILNEDYVVLVDEADNPVGVERKSRVHSFSTPLHRGFSVFLFKNTKQLLLQQRSETKKTWPMVWSNSCCGHPMPGESYENAVVRRTRFELGVDLSALIKISDYRYCFSKDGVMEHEICPVYAGICKDEVMPDGDEINAVKWISWDDWVAQIRTQPERYSPWCVQETLILASAENFKKIKRLPF